MKRVWLSFVVVAVLILAGCTSEGDTPAPPSVFDGGTQGLTIVFEPFGTLEDGVFTIFDTERFPIEVTLRNKGEEDVAAGDAKVNLKGINLADFDGIASGSVVNKREGIL